MKQGPWGFGGVVVRRGDVSKDPLFEEGGEGNGSRLSCMNLELCCTVVSMQCRGARVGDKDFQLLPTPTVQQQTILSFILSF